MQIIKAHDILTENIIVIQLKYFRRTYRLNMILTKLGSEMEFVNVK